MSGRYRNRRVGCGGCGSGIGRGWFNPRTSQIKNTVKDYLFYVGSSKQELDYEITAEFAVNHIKNTCDQGNDVAQALQIMVKTETDLWKPTLKISSDTDASIK